MPIFLFNHVDLHIWEGEHPLARVKGTCWHLPASQGAPEDTGKDYNLALRSSFMTFSDF